MLECPNCKTKNNERNYYCNWCGAILRENAGKSKKLKESIIKHYDSLKKQAKQKQKEYRKG